VFLNIKIEHAVTVFVQVIGKSLEQLTRSKG